MKNKERIVRYTAAELAAMRRRGESQTDFARLEAMTDEEVEAAIDHAEEGEFDWSTVYIGIPKPKRQLTIRLDGDVIEWFKAQGTGYQSRINAVLRSFVEDQKRRSASPSTRS